MSEHEVEVRENTDEHRFEVWFDGELAGFTVYEVRDETTYAFVHTEIDDAFGGHGLGSRLVGGAMTAMEERGVGVLPYCSFVRSWLEKHPDHLGLVPADEREQFGLGA